MLRAVVQGTGQVLPVRDLGEGAGREEEEGKTIRRDQFKLFSKTLNPVN